jgi:hypothetical protein
VLIVICAVSAGVHAALAPEHLRESAVTGGGFIFATVVLLTLIVVLTARPESHAVLVATVLTFVGLLVSYALVAAHGIPVLHPEQEPVDGLALGTKAAELIGLVVALGLMRRSSAATAAGFPIQQPQGVRT